jgi:hypothetical protein
MAGLEVDHSPPSNAEVICHHGVEKEKFTFHTNNMYLNRKTFL